MKIQSAFCVVLFVSAQSHYFVENSQLIEDLRSTLILTSQAAVSQTGLCQSTKAHVCPSTVMIEPCNFFLLLLSLFSVLNSVPHLHANMCHSAADPTELLCISKIQKLRILKDLKALFINPTDAHNYKITGMLKQLNTHNRSDMFRFTQEPSSGSYFVLS